MPFHLFAFFEVFFVDLVLTRSPTEATGPLSAKFALSLKHLVPPLVFDCMDILVNNHCVFSFFQCLNLTDQ